MLHISLDIFNSSSRSLLSLHSQAYAVTLSPPLAGQAGNSYPFRALKARLSPSCASSSGPHRFRNLARDSRSFLKNGGSPFEGFLFDYRLGGPTTSEIADEDPVDSNGKVRIPKLIQCAQSDRVSLKWSWQCFVSYDSSTEESITHRNAS